VLPIAKALGRKPSEFDPDWAAFDGGAGGGETPRDAPSEQARRRLDEDYASFAEQILRIRTKSGPIKTLVFNRAQNHVHPAREPQRQRIGRVRALILKGRQQGCSTYIGGRFYHRTSRGRGLRAFILTHEQRATQNLFEMIERFHLYCPDAERPATGAANCEE